MARNDPHTQWLHDSSFHMLVDYYTEIQFRPYGSGCTFENTTHWIKQLRLGYLCIYAKGHSGYTSFRSKLNTVHQKLDKDMCAFFRKVTRDAGCKFLPYYSGLLDGIAGERNPDWVMRDKEGKPKRFFDEFKCFTSFGMCPLSPYFDQWVSVHLTELFENYDPDGVWVDGDWPGPCYCSRCQARFRTDTGIAEDWSDVLAMPDFDVQYRKTWNQIEHEWRSRFRSFVKLLKPDAVYSAGNVSPRREFAAPFDWRSGDFFSPGFHKLEDMARMMRWYGTLNVPYDAFVCDTSMTHVRKHVRSRTKSVQRMMQEAATVSATGGSVGYWTFPLGNGQLVPSRMRKAIAVRDFIAEREDVFLHSIPEPWTAVIATDPAAATFQPFGSGIDGAHKALAALHRSPQIMDETGVSAEMPHDLLVLPEQPILDETTASKLEAYIRAGGNLLTSGCSIRSKHLQKILGVTAVREAALIDGHVLTRREPFGEPTGIDAAWDEVKHGPDTDVLYPLYLSWDQFNPDAKLLENNWPMHGQIDEENPEPAGMPAAIMRTLGKGRVVHICTELFSKYRTLGDPQILRWVREILAFLQPRPFCHTNAPSWVDVSIRRDAHLNLLVHFVNQSAGRDLSSLRTDDLWADEIPEVGPLFVELRLPTLPGSVVWNPGAIELPFKYAGDVLRIEIPRFHIHGCIRVTT